MKAKLLALALVNFALALVCAIALAGPPASPPVDVSGSISTHNTDTSAHAGHVSIDKAISNPNVADDAIPFGNNPLDGVWTISEVRCNATGGTSVVVTISECDANRANCAAIMDPLTVTAGTAAVAAPTDTSIADNATFKMDVGTVTGAVVYLDCVTK